jgi:protein gp37
MAEQSNIEWTDATWNPWEGCTAVSPACDHCYAEARANRFQTVQWGHGRPRRLTSDANWKKPLKWQRQAPAFMAEHGRRRRVFCASLADWADKEVPRAWRTRLLGRINETPDLDWLLLSKRHALLRKYLPETPMPNVRIGVTVENDKMARLRLPAIKTLAINGWKTFVSYEPALGPVDWAPWLDYIGWAICGGESGPNARPMHPEWARSLRDQCKAAGVPFFMKQWGEWMPSNQIIDTATIAPDLRRDGEYWKVGKSRAGHLLDGVEHQEFPAGMEPAQ